MTCGSAQAFKKSLDLVMVGRVFDEKHVSRELKHAQEVRCKLRVQIDSTCWRITTRDGGPALQLDFK